MIQFEALRADEALIDTDCITLLVFARAILHALCTEVQEVVFDASRAGAHGSFTLVARLLTCLADSINRCLVFSTASPLARLVLVQHEAWVALSASEDITSTLGAARCTELALLCLLVVNLTLWLTDVLTSVLERVKLHVWLTACAGLGCSSASFASRVALHALVTNLHTDVRDALFNAAIMEEELVDRRLVT